MVRKKSTINQKGMENWINVPAFNLLCLVIGVGHLANKDVMYHATPISKKKISRTTGTIPTKLGTENKFFI